MRGIITYLFLSQRAILFVEDHECQVRGESSKDLRPNHQRSRRGKDGQISCHLHAKCWLHQAKTDRADAYGIEYV